MDRRGDTLWQISRRVYGKGVRYTTIYVANKSQIHYLLHHARPDLHDAGQVAGKLEELHKERLQHHKP